MRERRPVGGAVAARPGGERLPVIGYSTGGAGPTLAVRRAPNGTGTPPGQPPGPVAHTFASSKAVRTTSFIDGWTWMVSVMSATVPDPRAVAAVTSWISVAACGPAT